MHKERISNFKLIGLKLDRKTSNHNGQSSIDCGSLWQHFEKENTAGQIPNKLGDEVYAVYFDYEEDHTQAFSYFIGCKVPIETETPKGLQSLNIPEQHYNKILAKGKIPDCISTSWKSIWNSEIQRAYTYDFELYDERSKDWSNAAVAIFVSVSEQ